jgi:rhodanese-related sulfurtransferase
VHVVCASGYRSSIAGSLLLNRGFKNVANVIGGMNAWTRRNFPVSTERKTAAA